MRKGYYESNQVCKDMSLKVVSYPKDYFGSPNVQDYLAERVRTLIGFDHKEGKSNEQAGEEDGKVDYLNTTKM